jgi:hypothetical protein
VPQNQVDLAAAAGTALDDRDAPAVAREPVGEAQACDAVPEINTLLRYVTFPGRMKTQFLRYAGCVKACDMVVEDKWVVFFKLSCWFRSCSR